ncbi:leucine--tRNA ligase [Spirosoma sp. KUDC1026]|uniref:leucine--tRNA ligase n=1 Tax=Spirosoma sp. KUDC1026 TaxID=2745947 RepID=UPI00159B878B|nr:class I tRNA ligase family protein [Spirosoma sp. KUDC1026]QKZ13700.1 leucine--tRNA ligase [Spirosoma sp. KUDC1026]
MAEYNHRETEQKWQQFWDEHQTYRPETETTKPKYYVLDMFPYPSGAGLHVGHPLGYIASDIVARYKRLKGYNVLHPMGFDSFGLPAEQYAIQTGQHPAVTTEANLARYIEQLKNIGFSYDWSREVRTSDPSYYKWTQWIFMELFRSWYNKETNQAEPIETLTAKFAENGTKGVQAVSDEDVTSFTADEWNALSETEQYAITLKYRLTFLADAVVNWCPALGTVLANDEVKDGVSERGGYPVEQKLMRQWMMRITAYADRLLTGLDTIDWTESIKEQQRNWIGKSVGASVKFPLTKEESSRGGEENENSSGNSSSPSSLSSFIEVFTTRVDTIYGVTFMVLAPEHELVPSLTTPAQREAVEAYVNAAKMRSERDRMADVKDVSGVFTGSYCTNPLSGEPVPIYLADYVLAGYGTGAVMAVPSGDQRDWGFAKHFDLPIVPVLGAQKDIDQQADNTKEGHYINSGIVNGMTYKEATATLIAWLEERNLGRGKVNFRMRDAVFSRQRYWGEPVPVYFKDNGNGQLLPYLIDEQDLPLELPAIDKYLPTETGEPPLGRAEGWKYKGQYDYELSTMPGWAGSSWYWYRYMDPKNDSEFASKDAIDYWQNVDLYIGGTEHATGHLLYSRFWNKFLKDRGYVPQEEPFKKLINQGMIQGVSMYATLLVEVLSPNDVGDNEPTDVEWRNYFLAPYGLEVRQSRGGRSRRPERNGRRLSMFGIALSGLAQPIHIPIEFVTFEDGRYYLTEDSLEYLKLRYPKFNEYSIASPELIEDEYLVSDSLQLSRDKIEVTPIVEKMSKSKFNVVNPDMIVERYGADVLRLYEMFLGPLEQAKPWNTNGIDGVYRFIRKFWRLFYKDSATSESQWIVREEQATPAELKILHRTIQKAENDIETYSFNTSVSAFMVCVNELTSLNCHKKSVLQELVLLLSPYAPHITEELWAALGNEPGTLSKADFPKFNPNYLVEDSFEYPIQINGKVRTTMNFAVDRAPKEIESEVLADDVVQKWLEGKSPKKVVVVPKRIVNVVV